jgi:hypothetical protein
MRECVSGRQTASSSAAVRSELNTLATFGIIVQRHVSVDVYQDVTPAITDAELAALLTAGNINALLARAAGKLHALPALTPHHRCRPHLTDASSLLPQDFTSDQQVGRVGSGPDPCVTQQAESIDAGEPAVIDAEFADVYEHYAAVAEDAAAE